MSQALAPGVAAQDWEMEARRVLIDHDPHPSIDMDGEQIPIGWGVVARNFFTRRAFVQVGVSRGGERRPGAVCGGFIVDPVTECIAENVTYSGGLVAISLGWAGRVSIGSRWSLAVGPTAGTGLLWVRESGEDTGRTMGQVPLALILGLTAQARYVFSDAGIGVVASVSLDGIDPVTFSCEDCYQPLREALPQVTYGLGLSWGSRPSR